MKFICIREGYYGDVRDRVDALRDACLYYKIDFEDLDSSNVDFSLLEIPNEKYFLYRVGIGATYLESLFLTDRAITFYKNNTLMPYIQESAMFSLALEKKKVKSPKTIFNTTTDRQKLKNYVDYLGGFPIIFKPLAGSKGMGVIKIESYHALFSTLEFLHSKGIYGILREYIDTNRSLRVVVIGHKAICGTETVGIGDEFRSNIDGYRTNQPISITPELNKLATDAVKVLELELGGVDIIQSPDGYKVLEVNFPMGGIKYISDLCAVDIASAMIGYLLIKEKQDKNEPL